MIIIIVVVATAAALAEFDSLSLIGNDQQE